MIAVLVKMSYVSCLYLSIVSLILTSQYFAAVSGAEAPSAQKEIVKNAIQSVENPNCAANYNEITKGQVFDLGKVKFKAEISAVSGQVTFTLEQLRDVAPDVLRIRDQLGGSYDYTAMGGAILVVGMIGYPNGDVLPFTIRLSRFDFNIMRLESGTVTHAPIGKLAQYEVLSIVIPQEYRDNSNAMKTQISRAFKTEGGSADSTFTVTIEDTLEKSFLAFKQKYGCEEPSQ